MGKLLEENAILSERLAENETIRRKFMEKNNQYEKEIKIVLNFYYYSYWKVNQRLKNKLYL